MNPYKRPPNLHKHFSFYCFHPFDFGGAQKLLCSFYFRSLARGLPDKGESLWRDYFITFSHFSFSCRNILPCLTNLLRLCIYFPWVAAKRGTNVLENLILIRYLDLCYRLSKGLFLMSWLFIFTDTQLHPVQGRSQEETTTEANTRSVVRNQPYEIF